MPTLFDEEHIAQDLADLEDQPFELQLDSLSAWLLMSSLQLACRQPGMNGPTAYTARRVARAIEAALTRDRPELARLAAAGWDPAQDQPVDQDRVDRLVRPRGGQLEDSRTNDARCPDCNCALRVVVGDCPDCGAAYMLSR